MLGASDFITIASVAFGFGAAMLFFRIQRELEMERAGEPRWVPWADSLIVLATLSSLLLVLLPLLILGQAAVAVAGAACTASAVLVAAYIPALLAHYRLVFGKGRSGPRNNPEPAEGVIAFGGFVLAVGAFIWKLLTF